MTPAVMSVTDRMSERKPHVNAYRHALYAGFSPWIKVPYTVFVGVLIPVYWRYHGPGNFLWFSDIALIATMFALWFELRLLASMMALAVLLPEIAWNIGFFARLIGGVDVFGIAGYMFDPSVPRLVRGLSLFHVALPLLLLWLVYRLRYDSRALPAQTLLGWAVLILSYLLSATSARNINWTLGAGDNLAQAWLPGWLWVLVLMIAYPVLLYLPTHLLLRMLFGSRRAAPRRTGRPASQPVARQGGAGEPEGRRLPVRPDHARLRALVDFAFVRPRRRR